MGFIIMGWIVLAKELNVGVHVGDFVLEKSNWFLEEKQIWSLGVRILLARLASFDLNPSWIEPGKWCSSWGSSW
jgi:hypothetical protein